MTMDSRVSQIESRFDNVEDMLRALVNNANIGATVAQPSTSPLAGVGNTAPAPGV